MSRGKEVKKLREKMGMNRREFSDYYAFHTVRFKIGKQRKENFRIIYCDC